MTREFKCTSCGADLQYFGNDSAITCNYCGSVVIVPKELRQAERDDKGIETYTELATGTVQAATAARKSCASAMVGAAVLLVAVAGVVVFLISHQGEKVLSGVADSVTRGDVSVVLELGGEGPGPGRFMDPRAIAVQGDDYVYVGDYETGRVQVFDTDGEYVSQWTVEDEHTYMTSLAAGPEGRVYVLLSTTDILIYDGISGERLGELFYPGYPGEGFEDVVTGPDGSVLAFRWHFSDDIVRFDRDGKVDMVIEGAVESVTGDSEMNGKLAVGGLGDIYLLAGFQTAVFHYSREGRYQNRFGSRGDEDGQFSSGMAIEVSPEGNVLVSDTWKIVVFGPDGRFLRNIETTDWLLDMEFDDDGYLWAVTSDDTVLKLSLE
ncbi:NHL repeat-containing protein [Candidatus Fermentibacterales bacterium]|nr:NHL repeat-containing protein [Candidatus Fermentibacterales bacterium]